MVVQFAFKVDFNSAYQAMWGKKTEVSTPKVLALRPNLHNGMHAPLFPEDNKTEGRRPSAILSQVLQRRHVLQACIRKKGN